jgi:hypothetical protein
MASPQLTPELIAEVSGLVCGYITAQREKALPLAVSLSPEQRATVEGFFLPQVLDTTRLLVLTESRVVNPPFYVPLRRMGFTDLPSFSTMAAVTFCDVVVSHQPLVAHARRLNDGGADDDADRLPPELVPGGAACGRMDASPQKLQISIDIPQGYY